ncbi:MAG TPA: dipeptide ABC transporter ATP-binding protein [Salinisphaeraceae bacterium]|nr:dipeptide ABC transporter ATP-binding protein [Salinisphaeraceae bacterium]
MSNSVVLRAEGLTRHYTVAGGGLRPAQTVKALTDVSFELRAGQTLAVVGESGCGKSTLARVAALIEAPDAGRLLIEEDDAAAADKARRRHLRRTVQMVFQDPYGSLNPRKKVSTILEEPLVINTRMSRRERSEHARQLMTKVGLSQEHYNRYPHMFSGGQRQRVAIARALMLDPKIVVADEPVSALDVSIQAQVLNLFTDLQAELGLAYLFITHDLSVVRHTADDVLVMYLGRIVENGPASRIFSAPAHPYTQALLASTPAVNPELRHERVSIHGEPPSPIDPPSGCAFHERCPFAGPRCATERPLLRSFNGRQVACHFAEAIASGERRPKAPEVAAEAS